MQETLYSYERLSDTRYQVNNTKYWQENNAFNMT